MKIGILSWHKSAYLIPTIVISWWSGSFMITACWLRWSIEIVFGEDDLG